MSRRDRPLSSHGRVLIGVSWYRMPRFLLLPRSAGGVGSSLAIGLVQRGLQCMRERGRTLDRAEVHVEKARGIQESVVVDRGQLDAVLPEGPGARSDLPLVQ